MTKIRVLGQNMNVCMPMPHASVYLGRSNIKEVINAQHARSFQALKESKLLACQQIACVNMLLLASNCCYENILDVLVNMPDSNVQKPGSIHPHGRIPKWTLPMHEYPVFVNTFISMQIYKHTIFT